MVGAARPRDRSEQEVQGYKRALDLFHGSWSRLPVTPHNIRRLHALCLAGSGDAGRYKQVDNEIVELRPGGPPVDRFRPTPAKETPAAARGPAMIRVVVVDDQTLVRQGICSLLELTPDIRMVAEAADGAAAIRLIPTVEAEVVLLDVRMPGQAGIDVLRALAGRLPPTILLTTFDDDAVVIEAARHGAKGFLLKGVSLEQLAQAIRTVAAGGTMILPALTERVLKGLPSLRLGFDSLERPDPLTPRDVSPGGSPDGRRIAFLRAAPPGAPSFAVHVVSPLGGPDRRVRDFPAARGGRAERP